MNWNLKQSDIDKLKKEIDLMLLSSTLDEIRKDIDNWEKEDHKIINLKEMI